MFDVESSNPEIWKQIKDLELREADAMLRADVSALDALWSDDLLVNSIRSDRGQKDTARRDRRRAASLNPIAGLHYGRW